MVSVCIKILIYIWSSNIIKLYHKPFWKDSFNFAIPCNETTKHLLSRKIETQKAWPLDPPYTLMFQIPHCSLDISLKWEHLRRYRLPERFRLNEKNQGICNIEIWFFHYYKKDSVNFTSIDSFNCIASKMSGEVNSGLRICSEPGPNIDASCFIKS